MTFALIMFNGRSGIHDIDHGEKLSLRGCTVN